MSQNDATYVPVKRTAEYGAQGADAAAGSALGGAPGHGPNPLLVLHSLLRGRYLLAIFLALVCAAAGAAAGFSARKPSYQSVGQIRIKPTIPSVQPSGDRVMPAFDAFVKTQQAFLVSEPVIAAALNSDEWQKVRPGKSPEAIVLFRSRLDVSYDKGGELIRVAFVDADPTAAMTGVKCIINKYFELYGNDESADDTSRMTLLKKRKDEQTAALFEKNAKMASIAGKDLDPETLDKMYAQCLQEYSTRKSDWLEAQRALYASDPSDASAAVDAPAGATGLKSTSTPAGLTPLDIAQTNLTMRQLLAEKRNAEKLLAAAKERYGDAHVNVRQAEQAVAMAKQDVEEYADACRREAAMTSGGSEPAPRSPAELLLQSLRVKEKNLHRLFEESEATRTSLGEKVVAIKSLKLEADALRQSLDETNNAIRQIELQSSFGGRIMATSLGDRPLEPFEDKRKKLAAGGAAGGAALGVAFILALGFLNRRLVSVHDARLGLHQLDRMLGVLPHVPSDLADAEQAAVAAHCVHHIRTLLQLEPGLPTRRVYSITSPSPGDGKTTLCIALGMSFASSGAKTLLIDCDIIGGGLSSKMDPMIRPKIGRVLCREGLLTDEQLQQALALAKKASRPLGEVLVEQGFVSPADVAHAAAVQAQSYVGLLDVLNGEPLAECVTGTGRPGLFILPLGSAAAHHAGQLSPLALQSILGAARSAFDVVLVDTGPILGSLEAAMAGAQSDGVVLAVSRGVPQALVKRSLDRLVEVGAYVVGMVLNRAAAREVAHFAFSSGSVRSTSSRKLPAPDNKGRPDTRLGSVGDAVAASTPKGQK